MRCRWLKDAEIGKYFLPECMGGAVYGPRHCTCPEKPGKSDADKIGDLKKRIEQLEVLLREKTR